MAGKVVAVHVEANRGGARIEAGAYHQIINDAVRPLREGKSDIADIPYDELAQSRKKAIRRGVLTFLQDTGELFPTE